MAKRIKEWVRVAAKDVKASHGDPATVFEKEDGTTMTVGGYEFGEVGTVYIQTTSKNGLDVNWKRPNKKQMAKCPFK
jgi:hypothetical protein